jgi:hypothetical protein
MGNVQTMYDNTLASRLVQRNYVLKRSMIKLVGAEFFVYDTNGVLLLLAHKKGFKLKEEINIYTDQAKTNCVMQIRARQVLDFSASYDVYDTVTQQRVGVLQRKGWRAMVRDEWVVLNEGEQPIAQIIEDSLVMALLRRLLTNLIPQNYDMLVGTQRVVDFRQNFNPFSYHLNVEIQAPFDARLALAAAVLLAAVEGRQSGGNLPI